jgi:hypothetical protein
VSYQALLLEEVIQVLHRIVDHGRFVAEFTIPCDGTLEFDLDFSYQVSGVVVHNQP